MNEKSRYTALGARLRELRRERGWSQERLAQELDARLDDETATQASVSGWESGVYAPSDRKLLELASLLGATASELVHLRAGVEPSDQPTPAGYDARIAHLPEHVRRTIDDLIDQYEQRRQD